MTDDDLKIVEDVDLPYGLEIDLDEGWRKLISSQFGGDAGRGFSELVQNFMDSYPPQTPWEERFAKIETGNHSISITDYGEGMDRKRLRLISTLGGTDKRDDPRKIGAFGIGFFSIFNPKLGTKKVSVTTRCEGHYVELVFHLEHPDKRPNITTGMMEKNLSFSTKITVEFDDEDAPRQCLRHAIQSLNYYPCHVLIDGKPFSSVWEEAKNSDAIFFKGLHCDGFIKPSSWGINITLLCKYEYVMHVALPFLITGGMNMTKDLRDFHKNETPYVPNVTITVNCNSLRLTISRDSYYMDSAYHNMITSLNREILLHLGRELDFSKNRELVLANQYILSRKIKDYLNKSAGNYAHNIEAEEETVIKKLAEAKVYRFNGRSTLFSLADMRNILSRGTPLFYSPMKTNLRWLGGEFKHDFIVLPERCETQGGAPDFYDVLFKEIFEDVVNLDTIRHNEEKIRDLVERCIVDKSALSPKCEIIGNRELNESEKRFLGEINSILQSSEVKEIIRKHLFLPTRYVKSVFFDLQDKKATIAAGIFDKKGNALSAEVPSNLKREEEEIRTLPEDKQDIMLGLCRNHSVIQHLMNSDDPHRVYYTLTYLAHELALCQKLLVPYSPFYHTIKENLSADMRRALMKQLLTK